STKAILRASMSMRFCAISSAFVDRWQGTRASAWVAFLLCTLFVSEARADPKTACISNAEQAQQERQAGHRLAARRLFRSCTASDCPDIIRGSCERWLEENDARIPALVVRVRGDHGEDVVEARLEIDERVIGERLDGRGTD